MLTSLRSGLAEQLADPARRFVPLFLLYMAVISWFSFGIEAFPSFTDWLSERAAILCYWLLVPFTELVSRSGPVVNYDGFNVIVIGECAGVMEFMIFGAALFAYPASWGKRLVGVLLGIPILFVFNVMRIIGLLFVGRYATEMFGLAHLYFWQAGTVLVIWGLWMAWIRFMVQVDDATSRRA